MTVAFLQLSLHSAMEAAGVEISHTVSLKYNGKKQSIPDSLIVQDGLGHEFLKVAATNQVILRLICGNCQKNASLAGGQGITDLKQQRNQKAGLAASDGPDEEEWLDECPDSPHGASKKKQKVEKVVTLDIGGTQVSILCPAKRLAASDLMVKLDTAMLYAVFEFLKEDCHDEGRHTRKYQKTGLHKKAGGKDCDEPPEE